MKTIQTILIVLALIFGLTATSVGAIAMYKSVDNDSFVRINNMLIDNDLVTNYKFIDKVGSTTVTCYGSYAKGYQTSVSISCVK